MGAATVLLVEDEAIVRTWIRETLERREFRVVGEAGDAAAARTCVARRRPDILLVDQRLPDESGCELLADLRRDGVSVPGVVMASQPEPGMNAAARQAGAQATLLKTGRPDDLLGVLREVAAGKPSFDPRFPTAHGRAALSPRERQLLRLVARGCTNAEAADQLGIGTHTAKTLVTRAFAKLGVHRRSEAVAKAQKLGLL